jgi:hypothetical protein
MTRLAGAAAFLMLAACAGTETIAYQQSLARAEASIEEAERQGAAQYGNVPLDWARDKVAEAVQAADDGDEMRAERLAREAELDAELASAITENRETQAALDEVNATIATLRDELLTNASQ